MDPQNERWPHVDIVRDELARLRAEMTVAEHKTYAKHIAELKKRMSGFHMTRQAIQRDAFKPEVRAYRRTERILRQSRMSNFTQVMLEKGARIYERLQDGGTITD